MCSSLVDLLLETDSLAARLYQLSSDKSTDRLRSVEVTYDNIVNSRVHTVSGTVAGSVASASRRCVRGAGPPLRILRKSDLKKVKGPPYKTGTKFLEIRQKTAGPLRLMNWSGYAPVGKLAITNRTAGLVKKGVFL